MNTGILEEEKVHITYSNNINNEYLLNYKLVFCQEVCYLQFIYVQNKIFNLTCIKMNNQNKFYLSKTQNPNM